MLLLETVVQPFAYALGPLQFTGFGVAVLLAFGIAQVVSARELERRGHDAGAVPDLVMAAIVGGLVGAKLYYVVVITHNVNDILTRAGFVFWGGLIGGMLAVMATMRVKRINIMRVCDVAGIAIAAAYAEGRTGCWAVGDDYGRPWTGALAVSFPNGAPPSTAENMAQFFHATIPAGVLPGSVLSVYPTQLFEVAMGLGMFALLWRLRDHKHAEGWLFGVYCSLAGVERFIVEFFRAKDDRFTTGLTTAQFIAVGFVLFGLAWMTARRTVGPRAPGIYATAPLG
ncbi:MAG: prolipoprotein diacylglyceryl transferase [Gemmatimonadaceae bacterium]